MDPTRSATKTGRRKVGDWLAAAAVRVGLHLPRYLGARQFQAGLKQVVKLHGWQAFSATTQDGLKLACAKAPAKRDAPEALPIVFAPGYLEVKEVHWRMVASLQEAGHDVILFDHRAHGESEGRLSTLGVMEKHDVRSVIDEAAQRGWVGKRLLTMGMSMGAATVLLHAAADRRVAGVVALAPFHSARNAIRQYRQRFTPFIPAVAAEEAVARYELNSAFSFDDADVFAAVSSLQAPVMFVVGMRDRNLPPGEHTMQLVEAKRQGVCELVELPGAGHVSLVFRTWPGLFDRIATFCRQCDDGEATQRVALDASDRDADASAAT